MTSSHGRHQTSTPNSQGRYVQARLVHCFVLILPPACQSFNCSTRLASLHSIRSACQEMGPGGLDLHRRTCRRSHRIWASTGIHPAATDTHGSFGDERFGPTPPDTALMSGFGVRVYLEQLTDGTLPVLFYATFINICFRSMRQGP